MPESIVEWKPRPRNRVFIRLSGGRFFTVPQSETRPLAAGTILSDEEIAQLSRVDAFFRGRNKALRLLAIRPRTRYEIKNALEAMELAPAIRDGILVELEEKGLIDDARFTREYVQSRIEIKRLGPHRLRFELRRLGVRDSLVEETLARDITPEIQEAAARDILQKKLGSRKPDEKDIRRLGALLRRKGMDYEVVNHLMYELLQQSNTRDTSDEVDR